MDYQVLLLSFRHTVVDKIIRTQAFSPAKKKVLCQLFIYFAVVCQ